MTANDQRGLSRIIVYLLLILLPLLVVTAYRLPPPDLFAYNLGRGLLEEEHHSTISSSSPQAGFLTSSIKASGDFTAALRTFPAH